MKEQAPSMARAAVLVTVVAAVLVLLPLGHRRILGSHEAVFPLVARDMLERGVWFDARLRGESYRNKPPLYPWAIVAFSRPAGRVTETTARAPVALAAIGAALLTLVLGARLFATRAGMWAALMLLTTVTFFDHTQTAIPDMPMVCFGLLAGCAFWSAMHDGPHRRALLVFYAALALGVFAKGAAGLLPLAAGLVWLWTEGGLRALSRVAWAPGIALFVALTAVWAVPFLAVDPRSFVTHVMWEDWLRGPMGGPSPSRVASQVGVGVLGLLPWAVALPSALASALRARREPATRFALCWLLVPLVLLLAVRQQRLRYLLPLYPAAALLVARWADDAARRRSAHPVLGVLALVAAVAAVGGASLASRFAPPLVPPLSWAAAPVVLAVLAVGLVAFQGLSGGRLARVVPVVAAGTAFVLLAGGWLLDEWRNRVYDFRAVAREIASTGASATAGVLALEDDRELLQVDFYLGRALHPLHSPAAVTAYLRRTDGSVVLTDRPHWQRVAASVPAIRAGATGAADLLLVRPEAN